MGLFTDVLSGINQTVISTAVGTVESAFGVTYDHKPDHEKGDKHGGDTIEVYIICPHERDECTACGDCDEEFEY